MMTLLERWPVLECNGGSDDNDKTGSAAEQLRRIGTAAWQKLLMQSVKSFDADQPDTNRFDTKKALHKP
ncbi:hypothetical protein HPT27_00765 [Permianibacter sp. IMCC34836]|uniref:hypothetical protein n=1 Tax=Permianibacter fluminis TaxID=2738515 RepID=UPI00155802A0|nr:hypothetical protein [Permianibacter fluminis]NQD35532.1 hypothetical protein [Permianibacter fluminis]